MSDMLALIEEHKEPLRREIDRLQAALADAERERDRLKADEVEWSKLVIESRDRADIEVGKVMELVHDLNVANHRADKAERERDEARAAAPAAMKAALVLAKDGVAHLWESGDDGRDFLKVVGDNWCLGGWIREAVYHPASHPASPAESGEVST